MKKIIEILIIMLIFNISTVNARNGDVISKIYSTDILALVNGQPIESYNIGGRTVIIAEDLFESGYGFYGNYNDDERLLNIGSYYPNYNKSVERGKTGTVLGNVYDTDIKVTFNGYEVKGYNVGGRTAICIEDLGEFDESGNNEYGYSKYLSNYVWNETERTIALNTMIFKSDDIENVHGYEYYLNDNVLTAHYNPFNGYYSYIPSGSGTEEFYADKYTLKPFYIEIGDKKHEVGICFVTDIRNLNETVYSIINNETKELLIDSKPPRKPYGETLEYLYNHSDYSVFERIDNDDYTVLSLLEKETNGYIYTAVKKSGGYLMIDNYSAYSDREITMEFDGNTVNIYIYPFAGPHGTTTMRTSHDLDKLQF